MKIDVGISDKARANVAGGLAKLLADSYTLYLKTHNYHWNVTGPMFQSLHIMFMQQYTELALAVDLIAERIRALGEPAPGSYRAFAKLTSIAEDTDVPKAKAMIRNLIKDHETIIKAARDLSPIAAEARDEATVDLLTARLDVHEKTAWMLRAQLED
jgi:starvation-inducible DNA-binding protein